MEKLSIKTTYDKFVFLFLFRIFLVFSGSVTSKIFDYSSAQLIPVTKGRVGVFEQSEYLVHATNLEDFRNILSEVNKLSGRFSETRREILKQHEHEILHILRTLEIPSSSRDRRAINFLGSALKFIAGTPDHEDFEILLTKQNTLIENSNRQRNINTVFQNRINEISEKINIILTQFTKTNNRPTDLTPLFEFLTNRNNLILNYLNNISLSIALAKNNFINPLILDEKEIEKVIDFENNQISLSNIFLASKIKILRNANVIYYVLIIPKIKIVCNLVKIHPVIHNFKIIKLKSNLAAKCNDFTIPVGDCTSSTNEYICKPIENTCLKELLNNSSAHCPTISSYHLPPIEESEEGFIILNSVVNTEVIEDQKINVNGTFLVVSDTIVTINGTEYKAKVNAENFEAHPPKIMSMKYLGHDEKLSLPFLHAINIDNLNKIQNINNNINNHEIFGWSLTFILIFTVLFSIFGKRCKRKNKSPENAEININVLTPDNNEDAGNLKGGVVSACKSPDTIINV